MSHTSLGSEESVWGEEHLADQDLFEDEGLVPDKPAFTGLLKPTLFKSILYKAKATTHMGVTAPPEQGATDPQDPSGGLFNEPDHAQKIILRPSYSWMWFSVNRCNLGP